MSGSRHLVPERRLAGRIGRLTSPALTRALTSACIREHVDYDLGRGKRAPIDVMPAPLLVTPQQLALLHRLSETINHYVRRLPELYAREPDVRAVVPFPDPVARWVDECWRAEHAGLQTIAARNDVDMTRDVRRSVAFETNGCSIGGIYYAGACARVVSECVLARPELRRTVAELGQLADACDIVADLLLAHAAALGVRRLVRVGILENRDWTIGITEMPSLMQRLSERGMTAVLGDPRELTSAGGGFVLRGEPVDVLYRNMELADFVELEAAGHDLAPVRRAFIDNRLVSGIAGDFDHKSLWELLTSGALRRFIEPRHRAFLRRHLLWTRLCREIRTEGPEGRAIDLVPHMRRQRRALVLKPNRSCGGEGVLLGAHTSERRWQQAVDRALDEPGQWVVQRFHRGTTKRFPKGKRVASYYTTFGVISSPTGVALLGRACEEAIVNVSRGGGLAAVFTTPGTHGSR
jgi:hypothetical protein